GVARDDLGDAVGERSPGIELGVPRLRPHPAQEALHRIGVVEQLAIQVARVPLDHDVAEIEHECRRGHGGTGACRISSIWGSRPENQSSEVTLTAICGSSASPGKSGFENSFVEYCTTSLECGSANVLTS